MNYLAEIDFGEILTRSIQITMSKWDGVKTVVVGGKKDVPQQYCGVVGGQSTDFSTIDTEIKVCLASLYPRYFRITAAEDMFAVI